MNTVIDRYRRQHVPSPTHCEPKCEPCSTCGMLECLCRPRFFAGQILTADDLNRLDYYIRGKHRLHNRQLHGWGVVNGLEVTCDACGPGVVVGCGYALSPCGDDIVVCDPVLVDVCALINKCKTKRTEPCDPPRHPAPVGCEQGEQEWVLAIRYTEAPTRGVKPLISSGSSTCGCPAPGKSGCGCGCTSPRKSGCSCGGACGSGRCGCGSGASKAKPRSAPVQCEPTIICEGFDFAVYPKPHEPDRSSNDNRLRLNADSEFVKRLECCVEPLVKEYGKMPGPPTPANVQASPVAWHNWACSFKAHLQKYLSTKTGYNCELLAQLNMIACPPLVGNSVQPILQMLPLLMAAWQDIMLACYCSALLPPCPSAHPSDLVPLATVRVSANPCRVLSICNWTVHRKFATTFPALQYWLSILPFGVELRRLLDKLCCFRIAPLVEPPRPDTPGIAAAPTAHAFAGTGGTFAGTHPYLYSRVSEQLNPTAASPERLNAATMLTSRAFARGAAPLDPQTFFESVFLPDGDKSAAHLSAAELANLPQFLALNQVLRPMAVDSMSAEALSPALNAVGLGAIAGIGRAASQAAAVEELKAEVAGVREEMAKQADEITRLKAARGRRRET